MSCPAIGTERQCSKIGTEEECLINGQLCSNFSAVTNIFYLKKAIFKTKIQVSGRISIPETEREALDISEGDTVQVILWVVKKRAA